MSGDAQTARDALRRFELARVTLAVADGERVDLEAVGPGDGGSRVRVETAAQKYYCSHLVSWLIGKLVIGKWTLSITNLPSNQFTNCQLRLPSCLASRCTCEAELAIVPARGRRASIPRAFSDRGYRGPASTE